MSNYKYTALIPPNTEKLEEGKTYHWTILKHYNNLEDALRIKEARTECEIRTYIEGDIGIKVA